MLIAAVAFVGVGAGGIHRLSSLGEIATGPAPPGEQALASSSSAREATIVSALTQQSRALRRQVVDRGDVATAGEGAHAGSAGTGAGELPASAGGAAVGSRSLPSSSLAEEPAGGDQERLVRDSVGEVRDRPPVRDRFASIDRVVDELLEELDGRSERAPPALRKLDLPSGD